MAANSTAHPQNSLESDERIAFSIPEWCASVGISRAFFYKLAPEQRPTVVKLGRRSLITCVSSSEWQERMTQRAEE